LLNISKQHLRNFEFKFKNCKTYTNRFLDLDEPAEKEGRDGNLIFSRRWDAMAGNRGSGNVVLVRG
jgi:hypothetical protein